MLQIGTTNYLYGMERLAAQTGSTRTWYGADALGSVHQTLDAAGVPQATTSYDPWGQVQSGSVPTFGFTGELHDGAAGLVNLRARWYNSRHGTLTSVDPFAGFAEQPYSQHPYQYAYSNPVINGDPTGQNPICLAGGLIPGPGRVAGGACLIISVGGLGLAWWAGNAIGGAAGDALHAQRHRFDTGGVPVPVLSAPHGAPQPAPTPVPFPAPTEQPRPIAVFPEALDCPPVVVQPGPTPQQPTPVISANPLPTPGVRGPIALTIKLPALPPNNRHYLKRIGGTSRADEKNTVVLPGYEGVVRDDIDAINKGQYRVISSGSFQGAIEVNGRYYKQEGSGRLFPVEGQGYAGFVDLNRATYRALVKLIKYDKTGNTDQALEEISRDPSISDADAIRAIDYFSQRGP